MRSTSQYVRYGLSEGSPSEEGNFLVSFCDRILQRLPFAGFQIDAQTVLDYLLNHEVFARTPIVSGHERFCRFSAIDQCL